MILKDIILNTIKENEIQLPLLIEWRAMLAPDIAEWCGEEHTLIGFCEWDGENLNSLDGDSYDLDTEIVGYGLRETESEEKVLVVVEDWN